MGASGLGKSTLLKTLAGEYRPADGSYSGVNQFGYCQQNSPLFPWLTVGENLKLADPRQAHCISKLLSDVGLANCAQMKPTALSAGMRRRVTALRAFLSPGTVVFLDEPFAGLDIVTRDILLNLVISLWRQSGKTILYVTHDIDEALRVADRIVVFGAKCRSKTLDVQNPLPQPRRITEMDNPTLLTMRGVWSQIESAIKMSFEEFSGENSYSL